MFIKPIFFDKNILTLTMICFHSQIYLISESNIKEMYSLNKILSNDLKKYTLNGTGLHYRRIGFNLY